MKSAYYSLLVFCFISASHAAENPAACSPKVWPISRSMSKKEIIRELKNRPRDEVIQMAVGELGKPDRKNPVDIVLLKFLESTEMDKRIEGYYGGIAYMTYGKELKYLVKDWPKRPARKAQLTFEKICSLYKTTLEMKKHD